MNSSTKKKMTAVLMAEKVLMSDTDDQQKSAHLWKSAHLFLLISRKSVHLMVLIDVQKQMGNSNYCAVQTLIVHISHTCKGKGAYEKFFWWRVVLKCISAVILNTGGQAGPPKGPPCKEQWMNFSIESASISRTWFGNAGSKTWFEQIFFILSAFCLLKHLLLSKDVFG